MDASIASVELGRYRRIVQMFWDPEPSNDPNIDQPVWCLGQSYKLSESINNEHPIKKQSHERHVIIEEGHDGSSTTQDTMKTSKPPLQRSKVSSAIFSNDPQTPPDSTSSSFSSSLAYEEPSNETGWPRAFIDDFGSRFWMTYRSNFQLIPRSTDPKAISALSLTMRIKSQLGDQTGFSSDSGWGCMIRSGQSLLANAMGMIRLGRDWRRGDERQQERELVSLFADDPAAPYSVHNFVQHGAQTCNIFPGEWFGPSATARCIQALTNKQDKTLRVYSTGDGPDVFEESFMNIAQPPGENFCPTLILVGTRLGIDKVTQVYWEALIASLQLPQSIGIAGGRPSSSHYFVGAQGEYLFYLDPHHTRKALPYYSDVSKYTEEEIASCHTTRLRKIHLREMDPSMLIGFLIQSEDDWEEWKRSIKHVQGKAIIHVSDRDPRLGGANDTQGDALDKVEALSDDDDDVDTVQLV